MFDFVGHILCYWLKVRETGPCIVHMTAKFLLNATSISFLNLAMYLYQRGYLLYLSQKKYTKLDIPVNVTFKFSMNATSIRL